MDYRKYKYMVRKGYKSEDLLIEFVLNKKSKKFGKDLFEAINQINPIVTEKEDLWMNDEMIYKINSNTGQFELNINNWNLAFINADNNSSIILKINELLLKDGRFEKVESFTK